MSTLFISGFNDNNTVTMHPGPGGRADYSYDGCCGIYGFMDFGKTRVNSITIFGVSFKHQQVHIPPQTSLIFNEISDPDSHHQALKRCEEVCWKLQLPVINHPTKILKTTRDSISALLKDIPGLRMPVTVRFTPRSPEDVYTEIDRAGLAFPAIVRTAGSHGGISSILINGRDDYDKLHSYAFDGSAFYLTEYVDYAREDGLYRKYRIVVVDGVPLFRHHLVNNEWMIHASSREFMVENTHLMEESMSRREAFDEQTLPMIKPAIDEINRRLGLEYYGIDCNIDDQGNILVFEVNANMNVLSNSVKSLEGQLDRIKQHIRKLIQNYATS
jgi:glutathione synthase/RimK-type ligase-like ATP-grasp enzyme